MWHAAVSFKPILRFVWYFFLILIDIYVVFLFSSCAYKFSDQLLRIIFSGYLLNHTAHSLICRSYLLFSLLFQSSPPLNTWMNIICFPICLAMRQSADFCIKIVVFLYFCNWILFSVLLSATISTFYCSSTLNNFLFVFFFCSVTSSNTSQAFTRSCFFAVRSIFFLHFVFLS